MKKIVNPAYTCLGIAGFLLFVTSFLATERTIDLHFHDTYFIIGSNFIMQWLSYFLLFVWAIYYLCKRFLFASIFTNLHTIITLAVVGWLLFSTNIYPVRFVDFSSHQAYSRLSAVLILIFIAAQLLFLSNILIGFFKGKAVVIKTIYKSPN